MAERLDLGRVEGAVQIDPPLARAELAVEGGSGDTEVPHQQPERGAPVLQLVRRDADVVELLSDGERHTVSVVERTAARR